MTPKKRIDNGKINYGTVSKPPKKRMGGETGRKRDVHYNPNSS
jgi:hypothetical protein